MLNTTFQAILTIVIIISGSLLIDTPKKPIFYEKPKKLLEIRNVKYDVSEIVSTAKNGATEPPQISEIKIETPKVPTTEIKPLKTVLNSKNKTAKEKTYIHGKKPIKGDILVEIVRKNPNGKLFYDAYLEKYGVEIADTAAISLMFENATMDKKTVGVCDKQFWIKGNRLDCSYANRNSAGFDVGVKQVNTFYQNDRINKLAGTSCKFKSKAESKERSNKCNQELIKWLIIPENNLKISLDLYADQGFRPWVGYKRGFLKGK